MGRGGSEAVLDQSEVAVKYMTTWNISEDNYADAVARFKEADPTPPKGVTMIGRWHAMGTGYGFALFDVDDPIAFTKFIMQWSDLVSQEVTPVVTDEEAAQAMM